MELVYIFSLNLKACKGLRVQISPDPRKQKFNLNKENTNTIDNANKINYYWNIVG